MIGAGLLKILEESEQEVPDELRQIVKEVEENGGGPPSRKRYTSVLDAGDCDYSVGAKQAERAGGAFGGAKPAFAKPGVAKTSDFLKKVQPKVGAGKAKKLGDDED